MTSDELATEVGNFIRGAKDRVLGVGDAQYSNGDHQRFEALPLADLFDWADEELQDIAAYAAMLSIRLRRIRAGIDRAPTAQQPVQHELDS